MNLPSLRRLLIGLLPLGVAITPLPQASAATFTVNQNFWGTSTTTGTFAWAIDQANLFSGTDVIELAPGLSINVDGATPLPSTSLLANFTESVQILGNGGQLVGNPSWINGSTLFTKELGHRGNDNAGSNGTVLQEAFGFAQVADNITIGIRDLAFDGLNGILEIGQNAVANIANVVISNSVPYGNIGRSVIEALQGSSVSLNNVVIEGANPFFQPGAFVGAIVGNNADFDIFESRIGGSSTTQGAVALLGGSANIVSSIIDDTVGGIAAYSAATVDVVNSLIRVGLGADEAVGRILATGGSVVNLIASTVQVDQLGFSIQGCPDPSSLTCSINGSPLQAIGAGSIIDLSQSAVSVINTDPNLIQPYSEVSGGNLTADPFTYVQPGGSQTATDLIALFEQSALLTAPDAYALDLGVLYEPLPQGAYPVAGSPLLQAIPDADGVNQLINPIDGSVITSDVFGNPRTAYGTRDIGAVQATQEVPGPLPIFGVGAAFGWSRRLRNRVRKSR